MPVLPCRANLFLDYKELYRVLLACQQKCPRDSTQTVSISFEISQVDPLAVLHKVTKPDQLNFYFENRGKGEAIAAIDAVAKLKIEGKGRFLNAQQFIKSCLANTITIKDINQPEAGPHFFCSFTFFDENAQADYPFPAATVFLPLLQVARYRDRCVSTLR